MSRFRRILRRWPLILAVFVLLFIYAAWPGSSTFTISPETTYITEPVDAQGYIDYPTALNERMSKGITPENNANVLIWQALGPHPEGGTMPPEYFKWLGIASPPEEGNYLISSDKYFQTKLTRKKEELTSMPNANRHAKEDWDNRLSMARKRPWKSVDQPEIAGWLKLNAKPLDIAIEASKRPQYFNPLTPKTRPGISPRLANSTAPGAQCCRELVVALACRAMASVADEDFDRARQDLMAAYRLGRHVASGGTILEHLIGTGQVSIAINCQIDLLGHIPLSARQSQVWIEDLRKLSPMPPFADKMDFTERLVVLDSLTEVICYGVGHLRSVEGPGGARPDPYEFWNKLFTDSIDWDPALRNANRLFDRYAAASRLSDREARKKEFKAIADELEQSKAAVAELNYLDRRTIGSAKRGELMGNVVLGLLMPAPEGFQDAADRVEQTQRNLQVAFALAAFRADTGRYPARLDELAPKYLAKIPDDLFSGKPLIYKPSENGYLLYSVGVNGIDEDGRWTDDDPKGDDLRVRMPVAEPKK